MTVTVIPIIIEACRKISKKLEKRLGELDIWGRIETIQTTTLLKLNSNTLKSLRELSHLDFSENYQLLLVLDTWKAYDNDKWKL